MGRARCAKRILITMGRTAGQSPMWNVFKENRKSFGVRFTTMLMVRSQDAAYASTSVFLQSLDQLFAPGPFHAWNDEGLLRIMDVVSEASGVGHGTSPMRPAFRCRLAPGFLSTHRSDENAPIAPSCRHPLLGGNWFFPREGHAGFHGTGTSVELADPLCAGGRESGGVSCPSQSVDGEVRQ